MKIYVRPLSPEVTATDLRALFGAYGRIESAEIPVHEPTGAPLGFGFVLMPSRTEASVAIKALRGRRLGDKPLAIREARPKERSRGPKDAEGVRARRHR
jgi:cold-inducible RNA-binding protein